LAPEKKNKFAKSIPKHMKVKKVWFCLQCKLEFKSERGLKIHKSEWCQRSIKQQNLAAAKMVRHQRRKQSHNLLPTIKLGPKGLDNVHDFVYLGYRCSSEGQSISSLLHRLEIAQMRFYELMKMWKASSTSMRLKLKLYSASICKIMEYGSESWVFDVKARQKVNGFNARCLSSFTTKTAHEESAHPSLDLVSLILNKRHRYLGHILRMTSQRYTKRVFKLLMPQLPPYPEGSLLQHWTIPLKNIEQIAADRSLWNKCVSESERSSLANSSYGAQP